MNFFLPGRRRASATKQLPVAGELWIQLKSNSLAFIPIDPLPRRVEAGEVIATAAGDFPLLSPAAGVLSAVAQTDHTLRLQIEGRLMVRNDPALPELEGLPAPEARAKLINICKHSGLFHFSSQEPLSVVLEEAAGNRGLSHVLFGLDDPFHQINWRAIFLRHGLQINLLLDLFASFFPEAQAKLVKARAYGDFSLLKNGLPERHIYRLKGTYQNNRTFVEQGILFLDAATLFYLWECLNTGQPFTSAFLSFRTSSRRAPVLLRLPAGYPLTGFFERGKINVAGQHPFLMSQEIPEYFDPFTLATLQPARSHRRAGLCNGCLACDLVCPVDARPLKLLETPADFKKTSCFACGLCSAACPASIDLLALGENA